MQELLNDKPNYSFRTAETTDGWRNLKKRMALDQALHSTVEYTLNSVDRKTSKKKIVEYLHHTFMDFNKAFDRAWHEELLCVIRKFNIGMLSPFSLTGIQAF